MHAKRTRGKVSHLVGGIILIAIGMALFFETLDLWDISSLIEFWPLILVAVGLSKLIAPEGREDRKNALWLLGLGVIFLIFNLGLWGLDWDDGWPLILVVAGLIIIIQSILFQNAEQPAKNANGTANGT